MSKEAEKLFDKTYPIKDTQKTWVVEYEELKRDMINFAQAYADEQNKELLEDMHEAFFQVCWIKKEKKYYHYYISAYESMQKKLIKAGVIKQEDCYRP